MVGLARVAVEGADVDQMYEDPCPFDVSQERIAQSGALVGTFDQARNVCDDEAAVSAQFDDAQRWRERGERVYGLEYLAFDL